MLTLEQAKSLKSGDILHHNTNKNSDGTCQRWRINGKVRIWKTDSLRFTVPIKNGLRNYDHLTENELNIVHLECDCETLS